MPEGSPSRVLGGWASSVLGASGRNVPGRFAGNVRCGCAYNVLRPDVAACSVHGEARLTRSTCRRLIPSTLTPSTLHALDTAHPGGF